MRSVLFLMLIGCQTAVPPPETPLAPIDTRAFVVDVDVAETPGLVCQADSGAGRIGELEVAELPNMTGTEQLAFAKRALRCSSAVASLIVYRIVPELLLHTIDGRELNHAYGFLKNDRTRALASFRLLFENNAEALEVGLTEDRPSISEPSELARLFRPEAQMNATCADLDGLTPHHRSQVAFAIDVLKRNHCDALVRPLLSRAMRSASGARAEACERADASMRDEIAAAGASDPGIPVFEATTPGPHGNIVAVIIAAALSPLTTRSSVVRVDHPGRDHCSWALKRFE
jgi:hypothetical protein